ncbi:hypothetical protein AAK899_05405 [Erysipelotrichaceae bacterium 51-3]
MYPANTSFLLILSLFFTKNNVRLSIFYKQSLEQSCFRQESQKTGDNFQKAIVVAISTKKEYELQGKSDGFLNEEEQTEWKNRLIRLGVEVEKVTKTSKGCTLFFPLRIPRRRN